MYSVRRLLVTSLSGFILANGVVLAADKPFTGVFQGQGRGCWGKLYVREQSIEWNTPYSVCTKTSYTVIQNGLNLTPPHISFALDRKSKKCRYEVIELSFDPEYPDYWQATGYQSRMDFDNRTALNEKSKLRTLSCGVRKFN